MSAPLDALGCIGAAVEILLPGTWARRKPRESAPLDVVLIGSFVAATTGVVVSAVWPIQRPFLAPRLFVEYVLTALCVVPLSLGVHWRASGWHGVKSIGFGIFQAAIIAIPVFLGRVLGSIGSFVAAA